jgi:hypothetical protein
VLLVGHVKALRPVEWFPGERGKTWVVNFIAFYCGKRKKDGRRCENNCSEIKIVIVFPFGVAQSQRN